MNTLHNSAMTVLPKGMTQDRTLLSSCPELCLLYEPALAAHNFHWCKTYLLHTATKLIACPCQLHSLQFHFSWPQTHLLSEGSWCTNGIFFSSVSVPWKEGSLLIFLQKISNDTCFSTVREYLSLQPLHTLLWLWNRSPFNRPCPARTQLWASASLSIKRFNFILKTNQALAYN